MNRINSTTVSFYEGFKQFFPSLLLDHIKIFPDEIYEETEELVSTLSSLLKSPPKEIVHIDSVSGIINIPTNILLSRFLDIKPNGFKYKPGTEVEYRGGDMGTLINFLMNQYFPLPVVIVEVDDSFEFYSTLETFLLLILTTLDDFGNLKDKALTQYQKLKLLKNTNILAFAKANEAKLLKYKRIDQASQLGLI